MAVETLTELYAFVVVDAAGVEGVLRRDTRVGMQPGTQPMIADSAERLEQFRAEAVDAARSLGLKLRVARFVRAAEGGGR